MPFKKIGKNIIQKGPPANIDQVYIKWDIIVGKVSFQ